MLQRSKVLVGIVAMFAGAAMSLAQEELNPSALTPPTAPPAGERLHKSDKALISGQALEQNQRAGQGEEAFEGRADVQQRPPRGDQRGRQTIGLDRDRSGELGAHHAYGEQPAALGVRLHSNGQGVWVSDVLPGSPAELAGLRPQDYLVRVNGTRYCNAYDVERTISQLRPGARVNLEVWRNNQFHQVAATLDTYDRTVGHHEGAASQSFEGRELNSSPRHLVMRPETSSELASLRAEVESLRAELRQLKEELRTANRSRPAEPQTDSRNSASDQPELQEGNAPPSSFEDADGQPLRPLDEPYESDLDSQEAADSLDDAAAL